ncbi:hypothetical protein DIC82_00815 [Clostridium beijerinckii]|nr:hypothetical protein DIC82_00815 [Clostridium beijerinckii]
MKIKIKSCKKFISFFLAVIMIWSMGFTGVTVSAATTDANNGDWTAENVTLQSTGEAQLMVRVGDIDNFGFGWTSVNPFSGNETETHSFPFYPETDDKDGTDRIMVVSGYNSRFIDTNINRDGYTEKTQRTDRTIYKKNNSYTTTNSWGATLYSTDNDNYVRPVYMTYDLTNISVQNAKIQMFVDDFQPGQAHGISSGTVKYTATINEQDFPELTNIINNLDQSGPRGKMITFEIPQRFLYLVRTGQIYIKIDDATSGHTGDGYAIDFVKLLINKTDSTTNTATITGNVQDSNNNNLPGATVSAGGVVTATTDSNGNYTLNNVPAGQAIVTASKTGYNSSTVTIPTVVAGGGYKANFKLTSSTPPTTPVIRATPTTLTNTKVTATIGYSSDSTIQQYRIDIGGTIGEWKVYTGSFDVTQNCTIEAQGINQYGNESQIASYVVSNIDKEAPILTLNKSSIDGKITATATDNVAVASITKPDNTVVPGSSTTYVVSGDGTYTFKATDTAGNTTTQSIVVSNLPIINATFNSYTPNPAKSSDEITVKYNINTEPFALSSGMIDEAVFVVDETKNMNDSQRYTNFRNGFNNSILDGSILGERDVKFNAVGYNENVNFPNSDNYNSLIGRKSEREKLRLVFQDQISMSDSSNNRNIESALDRANRLLQEKGEQGKNKAIILVTSGDVNYNANSNIIKTISESGYKIISLDLSNCNGTQNNDLKTLHQLLSGKDEDYIIAKADGGNYNEPENNYSNTIASKLNGESSITGNSMSIKDAKLNIDLGENFTDVDDGGLDGSGKIRTVTIPQINFTKNSATGLWEQSAPIEVTFNVNAESRKYGELGFGLYTNSDNSTYTNNSTISYTNFNSMLIDKAIQTPTITIKDEGISKQSIINSNNTKREAPSKVNLGETFNVNYTINFNNQILVESKPNRQQWLACVKDNSNNMNYQMVNDVQAGSGTSRASVRDGINFKLNKNNIKCNESYSFSNDSSGSSLSSRMNDALAAVTQKNSQGHERDIVIMIGTNISDGELQNAIATANNIKSQSDNYKLGINSIVINIGNKTGEENIKKLAGVLGGSYIFLNNADEASKINDNYISQLTANIADSYPLKNIYFRDTYSDNFEAVNAPSFITIDNTNKKIDGSFYANYYIQDGQIKCDDVNFTVAYRAVSYKDSSYIGDGIFNVINNETDQKILERVTIQVVVPDTIKPEPPVITIPANNTVTNDNTPTIKGTAEANLTVKVYDGTTLIGTVKADTDGKWTLIPETALADGNHVITATATDAVGNVSEKSNSVNITIGTAAPVIEVPTDNTVTNDNTPTISGTAEADSTVKVYDGTTFIGTVKADADGHWTLTPATGLADGAHVIKATATDAAGNVSPDSNKVNITIAYSSILNHGIYSGEDSIITASNNAVAGIPVTLAMTVNIESSNSIINWKRDNTIAEGTIVFKKYLLVDDSSEIDTTGTVQTLSFTNTGDINLTGLTTEIGKKYLIMYTITPVEGGPVTMRATADEKSSKSVTLNVGAIPDLF